MFFKEKCKQPFKNRMKHLQPVPRPKTKEEEIANALLRGDTFATIQEDLHCGTERISRVKANMVSSGFIPEPKKMGRPSKMTVEILNICQHETTEDPLLGGKRLSHIISEKLDLKISATTITAIRHLLQFHSGKARRQPMISTLQKEKRLLFCETALNGEINWGEEVVISDESRFSMQDDSRRMWIQRGIYTEKTFRATEKFKKTFMVWGAIGVGYKSELIFIDGNLNANGYQHMLSSHHVIPSIHAAFRGRNVAF
jgi:transposase